MTYSLGLLCQVNTLEPLDATEDHNAQCSAAHAFDTSWYAHMGELKQQQKTMRRYALIERSLADVNVVEEVLEVDRQDVTSASAQSRGTRRRFRTPKRVNPRQL